MRLALLGQAGLGKDAPFYWLYLRLVRFTTGFEYASCRMIVWLALLVTGLGKILSATTVDDVITRLVPKLPNSSPYWLYLGLLRFTTHNRARRGHDVGVRRGYALPPTCAKESVCHSVCLQVAFTFISRVDDLCYEGTFGRGLCSLLEFS